jgi:hypothetical protein
MHQSLPEPTPIRTGSLGEYRPAAGNKGRTLAGKATLLALQSTSAPGLRFLRAESAIQFESYAKTSDSLILITEKIANVVPIGLE